MRSDDRAFNALFALYMMIPVAGGVFAFVASLGFGWRQVAIPVALAAAIYGTGAVFAIIGRRKEERHYRELMEEAARRRINPAAFDFSKLKVASEVAKLSHDQLMELMDSPEGREYAEREREAFYARRAGENGGDE